MQKELRTSRNEFLFEGKAKSIDCHFAPMSLTNQTEYDIPKGQQDFPLTYEDDNFEEVNPHLQVLILLP